MQKLIGVEFDQKPNDVEIYKSGVDRVISAVETEKVDSQTGEKRVVWVCDIDRYTLLEYVYFQESNYERTLSLINEASEIAANANKYADTVSAENEQLNVQLTQTQLALTEVFELMLG